MFQRRFGPEPAGANRGTIYGLAPGRLQDQCHGYWLAGSQPRYPPLFAGSFTRAGDDQGVSRNTDPKQHRSVRAILLGACDHLLTHLVAYCEADVHVELSVNECIEC